MTSVCISCVTVLCWPLFAKACSIESTNHVGRELGSNSLSLSGKRSPGAPSRGKDVKSNEKLPSSITSVMSCFRDFCAIMWLLHSRDKMSKSSRKYRQLRSQSLGSEEVGTSISLFKYVAAKE